MIQRWRLQIDVQRWGGISAWICMGGTATDPFGGVGWPRSILGSAGLRIANPICIFALHTSSHIRFVHIKVATERA